MRDKYVYLSEVLAVWTYVPTHSDKAKPKRLERLAHGLEAADSVQIERPWLGSAFLVLRHGKKLLTFIVELIVFESV